MNPPTPDRSAADVHGIRPRRWSRRARWTVAGCVAATLVLGAGLGIRLGVDPAGFFADPATARVVAAGDMACDPDDPLFLANSAAEGDYCRHREVSDIATALNPDLLLGLGDYQYETSTADAYRDVYGPSWGRLREKTVPVFGNQEKLVGGEGAFTAYFGDRVRDIRGYWSQDVGRWHLIVLNSNCSDVAGGCLEGSPQQRWLAADLAGNDRVCVAAAWHHPRWSSGLGGPDPRTGDLYRTLFDNQVEVVLSGHDADYERFAPLAPDGTPDPLGVRQFVVGVGGQAHYPPDKDTPPREPAGEYVDYTHHGVLELELLPDRYRWRFHALDAADRDAGPDGAGADRDAGSTVADRGEASCF